MARAADGELSHPQSLLKNCLMAADFASAKHFEARLKFTPWDARKLS
jgi:hypothetical protein